MRPRKRLRSGIAVDPKHLTWWEKLAAPWPDTLVRNLALHQALGTDAMIDVVSQVDPRLSTLCADTLGSRARFSERPSRARIADVLALPALSCAGVGASDLRPLKAFPSLRALSVSANLKLSSIAVVQHLAALESLTLYYTKVTRLDPVAGLHQLHTLLCGGSRVRSLEPVRALRRLRRLHVAFGTAVDDLGPLRELTALEELNLERGRFSDLSPLDSLPALRQLDLQYNAVADLSPLRALPRLASLDVGSTRVTDLRPLLGCTELRTLACFYTPLEDYEPLGLLPLEDLDCSVPTIEPLLPLRGLRRLRIRSKNLGDVHAIARLSQLEHLDLGLTKFESIEALASLTGLRSLCAMDPKVKDLRPLAGLRHLESLEVTRTKIADLSPLAGLTALRELDVSGTRVTDLSPLSGLSELRMLVIRDMLVDSLEPLYALPNLELLVVDEAQDVREFRRHHPNCTIGN